MPYMDAIWYKTCSFTYNERGSETTSTSQCDYCSKSFLAQELVM